MTQPSLFGEASGTELAEILVYCDGGSRGNPGPSAIGAVVLDPASDPPRRLATVSERIGITTNNVAEYRALIAGLEAAVRHGASPLRVCMDSELVVKQMTGEYRVKNAGLIPLNEEARRLATRIRPLELRAVRRAENAEAARLVYEALDRAQGAESHG